MTLCDFQLGTHSSSKVLITVASAIAVGGMWLPFWSHAVKHKPPWCQRLPHTLPLRIRRSIFWRTSRVFPPHQKRQDGDAHRVCNQSSFVAVEGAATSVCVVVALKVATAYSASTTTSIAAASTGSRDLCR